MDWKVYIGVPGALLAFVGVWKAFDLPTPAWSADIKKLTVQQSAIAVEVYESKFRGLLTQQPPNDPVAKRVWEEELNKAKSQRDRAENRLIELSK